MSNAIAATLTAGDRSRTLSARFAANRLALFSLAVIVLLLLLAAVGPDLWPLSATDQDYDAINAWPTPAHPLGADNLGRDTLARLLRGLRVSLLVAVYVETLNIVLGATLGLLAGYFGGWLDQLLSRLADMLFAFPGLLLAILVAGVFGPAITQTFGGIGRLLLVAGALSLVSWPLMARTVRSITLALREREFIEAVLSLLGLGVQPPAPSIGGMIVQSIPYLETNWLQALFPSLALMVMVLTFSFAGDGLRDAFDPKSE